MAFVHATVIVCQQVLLEKDEVASAIRMAEVYLIPKQVFDQPELMPVPINLFISARVTEDDEETHAFTLTIERPSGAMKENPLTSVIVGTARFPGLHRSLNMVGHVAVTASERGNHIAIVKMDGSEIARAYFTLLEQPESEAAGLPNEKPWAPL